MRPAARPLDGALPAGVERLARVRAACAARSASPPGACACELVRRSRPEADARDRRERRGPSAVTSSSAGRSTGTPSTSAWNCIRKSFAAGAAVDAQRRRARCPESCRDALDDVARLVGDRLERRAHEVLARRAAREPDERAARALVPVRRAEPDERGHEVRRRRCRRPSRAAASRLGRALRSGRARRAATAPRRRRRTRCPRARTRPRAAEPPGDRGEEARASSAALRCPVFISRKQPVP